MTDGADGAPDEGTGRFVEQYAQMRDADVRRLAQWTKAVQGDRPATRREWWSAVSRELNSVGAHPAARTYQAARESVNRLIAEDARSALAVEDFVDRLNELARDRPWSIDFAWRGRRRSIWVLRFGLVAGLGCMAFLAGAIGMGLGGRRDVMSAMALIAFGLAGLLAIWYLVDVAVPPNEFEARAALSMAVAAMALRERLPTAEYEVLREPWRQAIEAVPPVDPPRRWRTAILGGRLLLVAISGGAGAIMAGGLLNQIGR